MAGIILKVKDVSFRGRASGWSGCPISTEGLVLAHFYGGSIEQCVKNFAPGSANSAAIGAPIVDSISMTTAGFGAANPAYLATSMPDSESITLISVSKPLAEVNAFAISNAGTTNPGVGIQFFVGSAGDAAVELRGRRSILTHSQGDAVINTPVPFTTPRVLSLRYAKSTSVLTLNDLTLGRVAAASNTSGNHPNLGGNMLIGSVASGGGWGASIKHYATFGFNRAITDAELTLFNVWIKTYMGKLGVVV